MSAAQGHVQDDGTPPTRPANDTQVEEFLKDQYKSTKGEMPKLGADNDEPKMTGA